MVEQQPRKSDLSEIKLTDIEVNAIASITVENGYSHISSHNYLKEADLPDLRLVQESYLRLPADENEGQRYRAYKRYSLIDNILKPVETSEYSQSPEYNSDLGGKIRKFEPIEENILNLPLIQKLIWSDVFIARPMDIVDFSEKVRMGLHQVRYWPTKTKVSFSSPPWLHKDDEPIVFIHLLNLSNNIVGGDNIIAEQGQKYIDVLKLQNPLDTLCVTNTKNFHAVTPHGVLVGESAYRDILLVTFENEKL